MFENSPEMKRIFIESTTAILQDYKDKAPDAAVDFPTSINAEERRIIHQIC
jgi:hypothetical protein